nr:RNA-directed DNA polymerase, eukaryota [Tanacetum cinerariifolium]
PVRGGTEHRQLSALLSRMESVSLSASLDRWICKCSSDGSFSVKGILNVLDDLFLPSGAESTRWVNSIPIKVNVFVWRARRDCLPTRSNLLRREWNAWFLALRLSLNRKGLLEGVFSVAWWVIWVFRNRTLFDEKPPSRSAIIDDVVSLSFFWSKNRCKWGLNWEAWLKHPQLIPL